MPSKLISVFWVVIFVMWTGGAAATTELSYSEVKNLLKAGKAEQSLTVLLRFEELLIGQPEYDLLLGTAQLRVGRPDLAQFALERVLMTDPDNLEARLMMAEIYVDADENDQARQILQQLSQLNLPAEMVGRAQRLRSVMLASPTVGASTSYSGYMEIAIGYDDNVSSGPDIGQLQFPALSGLTALGSLSQDDDLLYLLTGEAAFKHSFDDVSTLRGKIKLTQNTHKSRHDYDDGSSLASLTLSRSHGKNILAITGNASAYHLERKLYQHYWSGQLGWQRQLQGYDWLSGYLQYIDTTYPDSRTNDTYRTVGGVTYLLGYGDPNRTTSFYYGLYGGKEQEKAESDMEYLGYSLWGFQVGGSYEPLELTALSSSLLFESRDYDGEDSYYLSGRYDQQWTVSSSLDHEFDDDWHVIPTATHTQNRSNMALYDYNRTLLLISIKREF